MKILRLFCLFVFVAAGAVTSRACNLCGCHGAPQMKRSFCDLILLPVTRAAFTAVILSLIMALLVPETISAHGFAGSRFFPATLSTDDPFVADEFSLPTVSSIVTPDNVREFLAGFVQSRLAVQGQDVRYKLSDDFDLLLSGVIDSLGLLELVTAVNQHYGREIDFEALDPEQMTVIGPLCRYISEAMAKS